MRAAQSALIITGMAIIIYSLDIEQYTDTLIGGIVMGKWLKRWAKES